MTRLRFTEDTVADWRRLHPEDDLTDLPIVLRLVWCGRLAEHLLERAAVAAGLRRRGDYEVLSLLRRVEPAVLTPIEVAELLATSASGMTGKLDRLESQGLIERGSDDHDRRVVKLILTERGRQRTDDAFAACNRLYEAMLDDLTPAEKKRLDAMFAKLLGRLDAMAGDRHP